MYSCRLALLLVALLMAPILGLKRMVINSHSLYEELTISQSQVGIITASVIAPSVGLTNAVITMLASSTVGANTQTC